MFSSLVSNFHDLTSTEHFIEIFLLIILFVQKEHEGDYKSTAQ